MAPFTPRDPRAAGRALQGVLVVVTVMLTGYTIAAPPDGAALVPVGGAILLMIVLTVAVGLLGERTPGWIFGLTCLTGTILLTALDLATQDASTAAQVFFLLPVIFAAAHLTRTAAQIILVLSMLGEVVVTLTLQSPVAAVTDTAFLASVAVASAVLLVRANRRTDELLAELRHLAAVDPLTGLVTRRVLDDAASCALAAGGADGGTSFVLVDVDRFKSVNDSFGHPVGDAVLVHVAGLLCEVAGKDAVVSRLGGDELAVLLPGVSARAAQQRAETVAARVRSQPMAMDDGSLIAVTVSMGVAHAPQHAQDLTGLYRAADAALYEAKRAGRDRVVLACAADPGSLPVRSRVSRAGRTTPA